MFEAVGRSGGRGGARAAAVDRLTAVMDELSTLPNDSAATRANLAEAAVLERVRSWAPAQQSRVLASLEVAEPRDYDPNSSLLPSPRATTPHEIALVLRVSTAAARGRLEVGRGLVDHFPETLAAATDGTLPWWQARHALEETSELTPRARASVDYDLADHARRGRSPARFTTRLRASILAADPEAAEQAHVHSLADRAVWVDPRPDGTVMVAATLAAEGGVVFLEMADRLADTALSVPPAGWPIDGRTADQRRSDGLNGLAHAVIAGMDATSTLDASTIDPVAAAQQALAAVLAQATAPAGDGVNGSGAPRTGRRLRRGGQVLVTVSAETLLGISDAPGALDGYGPISAGYARRLAGSVDSWRRLLTDPATGAVLDVGRTRYTPTTAIAEHVLARSGRQCVRPGCPRPAAHLDHAQPWKNDGITAASNLTGLCVGDHRARHTGWTVAVTRDGATSMTTTHGFTATTPPYDHRPADHRPADRRPPDQSPPDQSPPEQSPPEPSGDNPRTAAGRVDTPDSRANPAEPAGPASPPPQAPGSAAVRNRHRPANWRPPTALARLQALVPSAAQTDVPTPDPSGVGDPQTGEGWLTDMHHYIAVTHDRARVDPSPPPPRQELDAPTPDREEPDDAPPF